MTTRYFSSLIEQSLSRSTEATLSIMGVTNPQLREHLAQQMGADCGKPGSFLASPVFQQMFGWLIHWMIRVMAGTDLVLTGSLLHTS